MRSQLFPNAAAIDVLREKNVRIGRGSTTAAASNSTILNALLADPNMRSELLFGGGDIYLDTRLLTRDGQVGGPLLRGTGGTLMEIYTTNYDDPGTSPQTRWGTTPELCYVGAPTTIAISSITRANPAVVTLASGHGITTSSKAYFFITGTSASMTQLATGTYRVTATAATTFTLDDVNSTAYAAYTTGGTATNGEDRSIIRVWSVGFEMEKIGLRGRPQTGATTYTGEQASYGLVFNNSTILATSKATLRDIPFNELETCILIPYGGGLPIGGGANPGGQQDSHVYDGQFKCIGCANFLRNHETQAVGVVIPGMLQWASEKPETILFDYSYGTTAASGLLSVNMIKLNRTGTILQTGNTGYWSGPFQFQTVRYDSHQTTVDYSPPYSPPYSSTTYGDPPSRTYDIGNGRKPTLVRMTDDAERLIVRMGVYFYSAYRRPLVYPLGNGLDIRLADLNDMLHQVDLDAWPESGVITPTASLTFTPTLAGTDKNWWWFADPTTYTPPSPADQTEITAVAAKSGAVNALTSSTSMKYQADGIHHRASIGATGGSDTGRYTAGVLIGEGSATLNVEFAGWVEPNGNDISIASLQSAGQSGYNLFMTGTNAAAVSISAITQANPAVITCAAHGQVVGSALEVILSGTMGGMTELALGRYRAVATTSTTYTLTDVNSTAYTTYTSGATVQADLANRFALYISNSGASWGARVVSDVVTKELEPTHVRSWFDDVSGELGIQVNGITKIQSTTIATINASAATMGVGLGSNFRGTLYSLIIEDGLPSAAELVLRRDAIAAQIGAPIDVSVAMQVAMTDASTPTKVFCPSHGLTTGRIVTISGTDNKLTNGTYEVTVIPQVAPYVGYPSDEFTLKGYLTGTVVGPLAAGTGGGTVTVV